MSGIGISVLRIFTIFPLLNPTHAEMEVREGNRTIILNTKNRRREREQVRVNLPKQLHVDTSIDLAYDRQQYHHSMKYQVMTMVVAYCV